jgi:putative aldouronate transport system permease protein
MKSKRIGAFDIFNVLFILLFALFVFIPVWYVFVISTSTYDAYIHDLYHLVPRSFTLEHYKRAFSSTDRMLTTFFISLRVTVIGTAMSMILSTMGGYVLSKSYLPGRNFFFRVIIITMFFSGGLAPFYVLMRQLKLTDTIWAMIVPSLISSYNLILMKNFFAALPVSLEEAARVDGYNDVRILWHIVLPLSTPVLAAVSLFYAVSYWNSWFNALMYVSNERLLPFQMYLRNMVIRNVSAGRAGAQSGPQLYEQFKMAVVIVGILPMLLIYPFVQKYFASGIMLGAVKE